MEDPNEYFKDLFEKKWKGSTTSFCEEYNVSQSTFGKWLRGTTQNSPTSISAVKKFEVTLQTKKSPISPSLEKQKSKNSDDSPKPKTVSPKTPKSTSTPSSPISTLAFDTPPKSKSSSPKTSPPVSSPKPQVISPSKEEESPSISLRDSVTSKAESVWKFRNNTDSYRKQGKTKTNQPEVDHVIEIQFLDFVLYSSTPFLSVASIIADQVNNPNVNLNVTTHEVNQKKKGPFTSWIHRQDTTKIYSLRSKGKFHEFVKLALMKAVLDEDGIPWADIWANIAQEVQTSSDLMIESLEGNVDLSKKSIVKEFCSKLEENVMNLELHKVEELRKLRP